MKKYVLMFLVFFAIPILTNAQTNLIPKKFYFGVKPTISTRDDVEKLFGKGDSEKHIVLYQIPEGVLTIIYSYGNCDSGNKVWGISEWLVEEIFYVPREEQPLRLRDVILNLSKFKKQQAGDVLIHTKYYNEEAGISAVYDRKLKEFGSVSISLTSEQKKQFACMAK